MPNTGPYARWRPYNRIIIALLGTSYVRGFLQCEGAGRHVQESAKNAWILAPRSKKSDRNDRPGV